MINLSTDIFVAILEEGGFPPAEPRRARAPVSPLRCQSVAFSFGRVGSQSYAFVSFHTHWFCAFASAY